MGRKVRVPAKIASPGIQAVYLTDSDDLSDVGDDQAPCADMGDLPARHSAQIAAGATGVLCGIPPANTKLLRTRKAQAGPRRRAVPPR